VRLRSGPTVGVSDRGAATVWAAASVAVLIAVLVAALDLGGATVARHRAEAAADLAALAAAGEAARGTEAACGRASAIAAQMGARVVLCQLRGWAALVEVEAGVRLGLLGPVPVRGRAHAGPAEIPASTPAFAHGSRPAAEPAPNGR
jgi:secretion/DNA translocation related TadE-like protein